MKQLTVAFVLSLALALWAIAPSGSTAHSGATGIVKMRMDAMKDMQAAMKALYPMLNGDQVMDRPSALAYAEAIHDRSGPHMAKTFPDGSLERPSEALPVIWTNWPDFRGAADDLERKAAALADALRAPAGIADARGLFKEVVQSCKSCHEDYRKQK